MGEFVKTLWFRVSIVFAVLGYFISFLTLVFSKAGILMILFRPLISALIMGLIAFVFIKVIEIFIPELSADMESLNSGENDSDENFDLDSDNKIDQNFNNDNPITDEVSSLDENTEGKSEETVDDGGESELQYGMNDDSLKDVVIDEDKVKSKKSNLAAKSENTIMVQGVPLEKDPALMAQAVQHVLDQDDED